MNILYLAHRIPYPPDKGDKLRSFRELEHLAKRNKIWCACFVDDPCDARYVEPLGTYCQDLAAIRLDRSWAKVRSLWGLACGGTITESFYDDRAMRAVLRKWSRAVDFDAVVAFSSSMAPYALQVPAKRHVLDLCDLDSQKWISYATATYGPARWLYRTEGNRLARRERAFVNAFDATVLITQAEAEDLRSIDKRGRLHIIGNGVVLPEDQDRSDHDGVNSDRATTPIVGFVGVMDYRPNVEAVRWFVTNCWQRVRSSCPDAVFRIVGRSPSRQVSQLAKEPGVEVIGEVDDVLAEVRRFDVSVAPMQTGRGLQNKVLEAMAAAKPVVLTGKAATGINGRHEQDFVIADTASAISERVVRFLGDPIERRRFGRSARRFVAVHHCWQESLSRFELIVAGAVVRTARKQTFRRKIEPSLHEQAAEVSAV